jgi:hypothetical protein
MRWGCPSEDKEQGVRYVFVVCGAGDEAMLIMVDFDGAEIK